MYYFYIEPHFGWLNLSHMCNKTVSFKCCSLFSKLVFRNTIWRLLSSGTFTSVVTEILRDAELIVCI